MESTVFAGSLVAIVTPFRDDGEIDWKAWARLVDFHLQAGTSGLVVGGTTGESPTITEPELIELTRRAKEQIAGRMQVIVGCGTSSTASTVERVRLHGAGGVDGLLLVTPVYNRPTQQGLFLHFEAAAQASRVPVILYNVPTRTAVDMLPQTVARLSRLPNIVAVKEAVASIARIRELAELCRPGFGLLSGDDETARNAMGNGACGVISVTSNVAPDKMSRMIRAAGSGDLATAAAIDAKLAGLHRTLFLETNPIPLKWALERMGLIDGALRLPMTRLAPQHHAAVEAALRQAEIALSGDKQGNGQDEVLNGA
jgi:4-hydroxy-tetrahydrodipicolinate synthase